MINVTLPLIFALVLILAGLVLFALGFYRLARRWFVIKIRMPLLRRFRYHPKRLRQDHYVVE